MPRPQIENCCVHVTHRCHARKFLLGTDIDRKQYVRRLREAKKRFQTVRPLNYVLTSNHVHLLVWAPRMKDLSQMIKWLHGTFAGDCNRRMRREGAFWSGRFHGTLVQTGVHLQRCLLYMDMNMVRTKVVSHPREWPFGGYHELAGTRQRYKLVDMDRLLDCLGIPDKKMLESWHSKSLNSLCRMPVKPAEPFWSSAFAVGDKPWLRQFTGDDKALDKHIFPADEESVTNPEQGTSFLRTTKALSQRLVNRILTK